MGKFVKLSDFLTDEELRQCARLKEPQDICAKVIKPNIARINK